MQALAFILNAKNSIHRKFLLKEEPRTEAENKCLFISVLVHDLTTLYDSSIL